jgi:hypothetical protein
MKKTLLLAVAAAVLCVVVVQSAAAAPANVTCSGVFTGTAKDLTVPPGGFCVLDGATVTHDVIVQTDAFFGAENSSIGHDVTATKAAAIALGYGGVTPGAVKVGHDVVINGSGPNGDFYDVCDTTVGHDVRINGTTGTEEVEIGDNSAFCDLTSSPASTIGHDVVVTNNKPGTWVDVGDNSVGHDLVVSGNAATAYVDVSDNAVGHDASCSGNSPPLSKDGPEDGPNHASHSNTCG